MQVSVLGDLLDWSQISQFYLDRYRQIAPAHARGVHQGDHAQLHRHPGPQHADTDLVVTATKSTSESFWMVPQSQLSMFESVLLSALPETD